MNYQVYKELLHVSVFFMTLHNHLYISNFDQVISVLSDFFYTYPIGYRFKFIMDFFVIHLLNKCTSTYINRKQY